MTETAEMAKPAEKGEFERVILYTEGYACILRIDCRLKFWWGRYDRSTSQYFERALHFVYTRKGKRTPRHEILCEPRPVHAVIVATRHAFDPPDRMVRDSHNPMILNQRYSYHDPRIRADFDQKLAEANAPLLADFRGMEPSEEMHQSYEEYLARNEATHRMNS